MRARQLKPGIFKNEKLGSADPLYTILFEGLWCMADREGRMEDRPLRICAEVFPYRRSISEKKVSKMLDWLEQEGFLVRYEVESGICEKTTVAKRIRAIQVLNFSRHQNPHTDEKASIIPALKPVSHRANTVDAQGSLDKSPELVGLTPDSGLLTPDSSLRERARARPSAPGKSEPETNGDQAHALRIEIEASYPKGLHRGDHWMLAERAIRDLLEAGESAEALKVAAAKYCEQQTALGNLGKHEVMRPSNFFGSEAWRGPFPLPTVKAEAWRDEFMRRTTKTGTDQ